MGGVGGGGGLTPSAWRSEAAPDGRSGALVDPLELSLPAEYPRIKAVVKSTARTLECQLIFDNIINTPQRDWSNTNKRCVIEFIGRVESMSSGSIIRKLCENAWDTKQE